MFNSTALHCARLRAGAVLSAFAGCSFVVVTVTGNLSRADVQRTPCGAPGRGMLIFVRLHQPFSSQGDVFPAGSGPFIPPRVGQRGVMPSSAGHIRGKHCWTIPTFFFTTFWTIVRALCCSIHSSLYLCCMMSKMGVGGLENIEKTPV